MRCKGKTSDVWCQWSVPYQTIWSVCCCCKPMQVRQKDLSVIRNCLASFQMKKHEKTMEIDRATLPKWASYIFRFAGRGGLSSHQKWVLLAQNLFHTTVNSWKQEARRRNKTCILCWPNGKTLHVQEQAIHRVLDSSCCSHIQGSPFPLQVVSFQPLRKSLSHWLNLYIFVSCWPEASSDTMWYTSFSYASNYCSHSYIPSSVSSPPCMSHDIARWGRRLPHDTIEDTHVRILSEFIELTTNKMKTAKINDVFLTNDVSLLVL